MTEGPASASSGSIPVPVELRLVRLEEEVQELSEDLRVLRTLANTDPEALELLVKLEQDASAGMERRPASFKREPERRSSTLDKIRGYLFGAFLKQKYYERAWALYERELAAGGVKHTSWRDEPLPWLSERALDTGLGARALAVYAHAKALLDRALSLSRERAETQGITDNHQARWDELIPRLDQARREKN